MKILFVAVLFMINAFSAQSQSIAKKSIAVKKIQGNIKIDGDLNDIGWKDAAHADNFIQLQPTPFLKESIGNRSEVNFVYNDDGVMWEDICTKQIKIVLRLNLPAGMVLAIMISSVLY